MSSGGKPICLRQAFEELETLLARNEICIAVKERLVKDSGEADERAYDTIVTRLLSRPRARGEVPPASPLAASPHISTLNLEWTCNIECGELLQA